jgi:signal transduction histidine kinase
MPGHIPSPAAQSPQLAKLWSGHLRRYWLAGVLGFVGLATTFLAGLQVDRWARERDAERFAAACNVTAQMIEQKMERYETVMNRMGDVCARSNGEVSSYTWAGWLSQTLTLDQNYPNILCLLVAPKILRADLDTFGRRAAERVGDHPGTILTSRPQADQWAPVWRRIGNAGVIMPGLGHDLLAESPEHPSLEPVLASTFGSVSPRPARLRRVAGGEVVGFWFGLPLRPQEFTNSIMWKKRHESELGAYQRRTVERARQAKGILAAFISGDQFMAELSTTNHPRLVQVQLFTSKTPERETLLNPGHLPPADARFTHDQIMPWYGRRWTARFHSTPTFEAGSLRYRAVLVWGLGGVFSLAGAAMLAWQTQGRLREAALAGQLREALARQERLSRDLHDGTLQSIYGVGLGLQRARRLLQNHSADADPQIADSTRALQGVIGELRAFIRDSDPTTREEVPLGGALNGVISHLALASEMKLELEVAPGADHGLTPAQSLQLLNIAREAVSNSVRHSKADRVRVRLDQSDGWVRLEVSDDGSGFNPETAEREGRGLRNLVARIRELHGIHRWESAVGQGSRLIVEVPLR